MKKRELVQLLEEDGIIEKHRSGWYRTVSYEDILKTASTLLMREGFTTTLDVKTDLRDRGYWVTQGYVSEVMDSLQSVGVLKYIDNGTYRKYYIA